MSDDAIMRFTRLVLFQAQQDHAQELVVASSAVGGSPIKYKVSGTWHDFSPPPSEIMPEVVAELARLAEATEGRFPKEGSIDEAFSGIRLRWKFRMPSAGAACVLTPIQE